MGQLEKRLNALEFRQRASIRVAIVKVDGTELEHGITTAEQLRRQETDIDFPLPDSARKKILSSSPPPGCISLHFFNSNEDRT